MKRKSSTKNKISKDNGSSKLKDEKIGEWKKYILSGAAGLAILGAGIGIGYGISERRFGNRVERPSLYVKTLDELVGRLYELRSYEALVGTSPYGNTTNILKIVAEDYDGPIYFTVYERDHKKFIELICYAEQARKTGNPFGIVDPLKLGVSYPIDSRSIVNLRVERGINNVPVYIVDGDDLIFYWKHRSD